MRTDFLSESALPESADSLIFIRSDNLIDETSAFIKAHFTAAPVITVDAGARGLEVRVCPYDFALVMRNAFGPIARGDVSIRFLADGGALKLLLRLASPISESEAAALTCAAGSSGIGATASDAEISIRLPSFNAARLPVYSGRAPVFRLALEACLRDLGPT